MTKEKAEKHFRKPKEETWWDYLPVIVLDVNTGQRWWRKMRWQEYRLTEAHFKDLALVETTLYFIKWRKTREGIELRPVVNPVWGGIVRMLPEQADRIWRAVYGGNRVGIGLDGRVDNVVYNALIDQITMVLAGQCREPDEIRVFDANLGKKNLLKYVEKCLVPKRKDAEFWLLFARKLLAKSLKR